jgi:hypothetical protein
MNSKRKNERGVTILVVAFILFAMISMAALSVDLAELYVARGETQRAADAAALAGAKMFVTSGFTSSQGSGALIADGSNGDVCQGAILQAEAVAAENTIAGQPATIVSTPVCDVTTNPQNPTISVTIQRADVPTFFARIWGNTGNTVNATAVAEAYNPSGNTTTPATVPVATSVKPWLVPNCDPTGAAGSCTDHYFVDANGNIANRAPPLVGQTIQLSLISSGHATATGVGGDTIDFYPLNLPSTSPTPAPICPACAAGNSYAHNIACSSQYRLSCGETISPSSTVKIRTGFGLSTSTKSGARCLIHNYTGTDGPSLGQDILTSPGPPTVIQGGDENPNLALRAADDISRSDSVVTVPIYQDLPTSPPLCASPGTCGGTATVIGFVQLAITQTNSSGPQIQGVVLNVSGCSPDSIAAFPSSQTVVGSGTSPIPVRLIHN